MTWYLEDLEDDEWVLRPLGRVGTESEDDFEDEFIEVLPNGVLPGKRNLDLSTSILRFVILVALIIFRVALLRRGEDRKQKGDYPGEAQDNKQERSSDGRPALPLTLPSDSSSTSGLSAHSASTSRIAPLSNHSRKSLEGKPLNLEHRSGVAGTQNVSSPVTSTRKEDDIPFLTPERGGGYRSRLAHPPSSAESEQTISAVSLQTTSQMQVITQTPTTIAEYKHTVHAVESVIRSTGMDRAASLKMANEIAVRRLEADFSNATALEEERRRVEREDNQRREDQLIQERRHKEALLAMRRVPGWEEKLEKARKGCLNAAFDVFPGLHLLTCLWLAFVTRILRENSDTLTTLTISLPKDFLKNVVDCLVSQLCGCEKSASEQIDEVAPERSAQIFSHLSAWVPPFGFLSSVTPVGTISGIFSSSACYGSCIFGFIMHALALFLSHRVLGLFCVQDNIHYALNFVMIAGIIIPSLWDKMHRIVLPVVAFNFSLACLFWVVGFRCFRATEHSSVPDKSQKRILSLLVTIRVSLYLLSSVGAAAVGWGHMEKK